MAPVVEATAELRGLGHDGTDIARLFLNGAAIVLDGRSETEFLELARQMWRAKERQLELVSMLDRVQVSREYRVRFRPERKRREVRAPLGVTPGGQEAP